jgi:HlyD family secretion protein
MSAIANTAATRSPAPGQAAPKAPLPVKPPSRRWLLWLILIAAVAAGAWLMRPRTQQKPAVQTVVRTFKVVPTRVERTIRVAGTTSARNFANIVAPMMRGPDAGRALVLIDLAKSGVVVKKGEKVAQIDAQSTIDHVDDVNSLVIQAERDVQKRKADQAIETERLQQSLRQSKAALDKARLDFNAKEIRTEIDKELLDLSVQEAESTYKELQREVQIQKVAQASEIRILELTRDRHARHRDRHKGDIEKFTIYAPMPGLVVMQSLQRGGDMAQVQVGDQVSPGQPFMKIVDTTGMQVQAQLNQVESEEIRIGQKAEVHFDAFPDLVLHGHVFSIGALAAAGWRQSYFIRNVPVNISIESSDPRLIPDLSASGDIAIAAAANALAIPQEAVFDEGGKPTVYVRQSGQFQPRVVQLGTRNNTQVVVQAGLSAGDEIALQKPAVQTP